MNDTDKISGKGEENYECMVEGWYIVLPFWINVV